MPKKQIYLTGFMGTGKSMILNCLHEVCGFDKIEMDEQIVQEQGMSIPEIFEKKGEFVGPILLLQKNVIYLSCNDTFIFLRKSAHEVFRRGYDKRRTQVPAAVIPDAACGFCD